MTRVIFIACLLHARDVPSALIDVHISRSQWDCMVETVMMYIL